MSVLSVGSQALADFLIIEYTRIPISSLRITSKKARPAPVNTDPWHTVPPYVRTIVRGYINSERDNDRERALELCAEYELDYQTMRRLVHEELVAQIRALGKAWTPAEGSRPLAD